MPLFGKNKNSSKKVSLTILVPEVDKEWVEQQAQAEERTVSDVVRGLLRAHRPNSKGKRPELQQ